MPRAERFTTSVTDSEPTSIDQKEKPSEHSDVRRRNMPSDNDWIRDQQEQENALYVRVAHELDTKTRNNCLRMEARTAEIELERFEKLLDQYQTMQETTTPGSDESNANEQTIYDLQRLIQRKTELYNSIYHSSDDELFGADERIHTILPARREVLELELADARYRQQVYLRNFIEWEYRVDHGEHKPALEEVKQEKLTLNRSVSLTERLEESIAEIDAELEKAS